MSAQHVHPATLPPEEPPICEEVDADDSWYADPSEVLDGVTRPRGFVRSAMESWPYCAAGCGRTVDPDASGTDLSSGVPVCSHCSLVDEFHFGLPDRKDEDTE